MSITLAKRSARQPKAGCRGLSRFEFALVVVVIGILVSLLLSRLSDLPNLAGPARLQAAMHTVRAAAQLFHTRCQLLRERAPAERCESLAMDGVTVAGAHGWPAASADGIAVMAALQPSGGSSPALPLRLRTGERQGRPALFIALAERGCEFSYVQAASPDTPPEVDIVDPSCH